MTHPLIDTHAHIDDERFDPDRAAVIARAVQAGVSRIVAVGITVQTSQRCIELARQYSELAPTVGIHPNSIAQSRPGDWDSIQQLAQQTEVVGIGETGLDRHWDFTPFATQQDYFARHLELGQRLNKPVVIHCREAANDVLAMLRDHYHRHGPIRAVMHSFCEDAATAAECVAMGLYVSFAGMLTYKNAADLRAVAAIVPIERLLVETDCPYLAPQPVRGKRNEPAYVRHTAVCLAGLLGVSLTELAEQTTANAQRLFGLT